MNTIGLNKKLVFAYVLKFARWIWKRPLLKALLWSNIQIYCLLFLCTHSSMHVHACRICGTTCKSIFHCNLFWWPISTLKVISLFFKRKIAWIVFCDKKLPFDCFFILFALVNQGEHFCSHWTHWWMKRFTMSLWHS